MGTVFLHHLVCIDRGIKPISTAYETDAITTTPSHRLNKCVNEPNNFQEMDLVEPGAEAIPIDEGNSTRPKFAELNRFTNDLYSRKYNPKL